MTLKGRPSPEKGKAYEEYLKTLNCCFFLSPLYKYHVYSQVTAPWFSQDSSLEFTSTVTSRDFWTGIELHYKCYILNTKSLIFYLENPLW